MIRVLLVLSLLGLVACNGQGDERLEEKARIEGAQAAREEAKVQLEEKEKQIKAELKAQIDNIDLVKQKAREEGKAQAEANITEQNANLSRRSQEMESDLRVRHRFYQAVRGVYEGTLKAEKKDWFVRVTLVPSLPPYNVNRVRQLEEVAFDLNNLYFNAQVVQWNPKDKSVATSCRVEHVRPDIVNGEVTIASENCPNLYFLRITEGEGKEGTASVGAGSKGDGGTTLSGASDGNFSASLALAIREGRTSRVKRIEGFVQPATDASIYELTAIRVSR